MSKLKFLKPNKYEFEFNGYKIYGKACFQSNKYPVGQLFYKLNLVCTKNISNKLFSLDNFYTVKLDFNGDYSPVFNIDCYSIVLGDAEIFQNNKLIDKTLILFNILQIVKDEHILNDIEVEQFVLNNETILTSELYNLIN